jgi:hypothetical protein
MNPGIRRACCGSWSVEPRGEARRLAGVGGWRERGRRVGAEAGGDRSGAGTARRLRRRKEVFGGRGVHELSAYGGAASASRTREEKRLSLPERSTRPMQRTKP